MKYTLQIYRKLPVTVKKAEGKFIQDESGRKYLDFFSGISVNNFGHRPSEVVKAVKSQADRYLHVSNLYTDRNQEKYARLIIKASFPGKVFFSNSGGEANELAIKLVRRAGETDGRYRIISFKNSFHGRSMSTLSATGQKKFHKGFRPLLSGFDYAVFNDMKSVKKKIGPRTAAIIVEPVQGEGGVYPADGKFMKSLKKICRKNKLILIFDEIQTGFGRTGEIFAFSHFGVRPDIMTLAKAAGGGLPLGVTVIGSGLEKYLPYGSHGSTFGGNPVSVASGMAAFRLLNGRMLKKIRKLSGILERELKKTADKYPAVREVRILGLMAAMEFRKSYAAEAADYFLREGILVNACKEDVVRFLPPFVIKEEDILRVTRLLDCFLKGKNAKLLA